MNYYRASASRSYKIERNLSNNCWHFGNLKLPAQHVLVFPLQLAPRRSQTTKRQFCLRRPRHVRTHTYDSFGFLFGTQPNTCPSAHFQASSFETVNFRSSTYFITQDLLLQKFTFMHLQFPVLYLWHISFQKVENLICLGDWENVDLT